MANCKPNELAVIVRYWEGCRPSALGKVVLTVTLYDDVRLVGADGTTRDMRNVWNVEYQGSNMRSERLIGVPDFALRPIRDPGDDAVDETLIYAGDPRVRELAS